LSDYKISVVIPVKNGAATLERCLESITEQTINGDVEIIILDSTSTDASVEISGRYDARIIKIPEGSFNHGLTRNMGATEAHANLVFYTVQDAFLGSRNMLEKMASHFRDASVMGVMGHQAVPHEKDKNPLLWYRPYSAPEVSERLVTSQEAFANMPVKDQQSLISWDNVVAMYRKDALLKQPFVKTEFSEDWVWSYQALLKGWKLLYDSSLVVYHYHHQAYKYAFNIAYTGNYHFYKFFKYKPSIPPLLMPVAKATYHLLKNKKLGFREKLYWIQHNWRVRLANYFSTINFLIRLKLSGEEGIAKGYNKYCKKIPQGKQKIEQLQ
jgi:rhamnosyltransferase